MSATNLILFISSIPRCLALYDNWTISNVSLSSNKASGWKIKYNVNSNICYVMLVFTIELTSREELVELLNADNDLCKNVGEPLCADI